jgi:transcriptional regulator GlxA family with amidase domain
MSLRTFARTFVTRTGLTPAKAVEMVRVQAARCAAANSCLVPKAAREQTAIS